MLSQISSTLCAFSFSVVQSCTKQPAVIFSQPSQVSNLLTSNSAAEVFLSKLFFFFFLQASTCVCCTCQEDSDLMASMRVENICCHKKKKKKTNIRVLLLFLNWSYWKSDTSCTIPAGLQWRDQTGAAEGALAAQRLRGVQQREEHAGEECTTSRHRIREVRHKLKSAGGEKN